MSLQMTPQEVSTAQNGGIPPKQATALDSLNVDSLLEMRSRIDQLLPATTLKDMNLEKEVVIQYQTLKSLQTTVLSDDETPANQRAQVANSVGTTLQTLAKMQMEQYSSERFKQIEMILINLLNTWPLEQTQKFFDEYEKLKI